jgi:galactokinase
MTSLDDVASLFESTFGMPPAGVWSAPGRVNLIGEHTDYTGGFVMPLAIGQRAFVAALPREDRFVRAVAAGRGVESIVLDEVRLGVPQGWLAYLAGAAWVASQARGRSTEDHGWDLALVSDVPVGAGLSSSAALTCASLLAMNELGGWGADRQQLATWAQRVEHDVAGIPCGIMDQTASLQCTAGHVLFMDTRSHELIQVPWPAAETGFVLLVTDTHAPHVLVDGQYADRRRLCEEATAILGVDSLRDATRAALDAAAGRLSEDQAACARHVVSENARVLRTRDLLTGGRGLDIGPELTASHVSLRDDFRVTVPPLDCAVDAALAAGARGARMTGGGFGGCTIALVDAGSAESVSGVIDTAFAEAGFAAPEHFIAVPSEGARRES